MTQLVRSLIKFCATFITGSKLYHPLIQHLFSDWSKSVPFFNQIKEGVQRIYADADTGTTYGYKDPTGGEAEKGHDEMLMKEKRKKIQEELEEDQL